MRNSYDGEKKELFDDFFVFEALNELTPMTENDFNNFKNTIYDKFNRQGYLIYIDKYYIFQPFDQNENVPMYYRSIFDKSMQNQLSLYNYLKNVTKTVVGKTKKTQDMPIDKTLSIYNFDDIREYYDSREEFKHVGIIDKESSRRKTKSLDELSDVFKIREKRKKHSDKKRETGLASLLGSVCATSKDRAVLVDIAKDLNVNTKKEETRFDICENIKDKLLFLEKYGTSKKKTKMTYMIIPRNHPKLKFPYNIEDRKDHIVNSIKEKIKFKLDLSVKELHSKVQGENVIFYSIELENTKDVSEFTDFLRSLGFVIHGKKWIIIVD